MSVDDSTHSTLDSSLHAWTTNEEEEGRDVVNPMYWLSNDYTVIRK